jgi:hypothetical protein
LRHVEPGVDVLVRSRAFDHDSIGRVRCHEGIVMTPP